MPLWTVSEPRTLFWAAGGRKSNPVSSFLNVDSSVLHCPRLRMFRNAAGYGHAVAMGRTEDPSAGDRRQAVEDGLVDLLRFDEHRRGRWLDRRQPAPNERESTGGCIYCWSSISSWMGSRADRQIGPN
jgi:hypothetical protein